MAPRKVVRATAELAERDPVLAKVIEAAGPCRLGERRNPDGPFAALVRMVCFQQLAGKAAAAIHGRVLTLFDGPPTPEAVMALDVETLRGAGLSGSKTATIRDLSEHA